MAAYSQITENRAFSLEVLAHVQPKVAEAALDGVRCVAIAGSFGRLEASHVSDADLIIVLDDEVAEAGDEQRTVIETVVVDLLAAAFEERGIERPNPEGVFAKPRTLAELLPPIEAGGIGTHTEASDIMGKRLLLLMESRAIWNEAAYEDVIDQIFNRYAELVRADPTKEYVYLLNDLIRYFRFICVNYQSTFGNQNEKWAIRNVKLRHSRIIIYIGLLALLGSASTYRDDSKIDAVRQQLALSPLERLEHAYDHVGDFGFYKVAGLYNAFLMRLSDPDVRTQLNAIEYPERYANPYFATIKANSDALQSELTNFLFRRRGQWSDRFFEYLLF